MSVESGSVFSSSRTDELPIQKPAPGSVGTLCGRGRNGQEIDSGSIWFPTQRDHGLSPTEAHQLMSSCLTHTRPHTNT